MHPIDRFAKYLLKSILLCSVALFLYPLIAIANGQPGTFMATGSMITPRFQHTVTVLANGQVLAAGGADATNPFNPVASAELYNPATGVFRATGSMSTTRIDHTATLLPNGRVLIVGGNGGPVTSAELYDPATGTFSVTGSLTTNRTFHTATLLPNGKVLIAGGAGAGAGQALASAELYDPGAGSFSPTGSMITARSGQYATLLADGQVLIAGGASASGGNATVLASAELYDPATGIFSATGSLVVARQSPGTTALLFTGQVLFAGGSSGAAGNAPSLASAELYDPSTGTFSLTGSMTTPRSKHNVALLPSGQVLVMGGVNPSVFGPLASAELYDPMSATFSLTGSMTIPRFFVYPTVVLLPDGQALVAGGADNGPVASAELYTVTVTGPAPASGTSCNGVYNGTFNGNLTVSAGQDCFFVDGGVTGNVTQTGGNLQLLQSKVAGNVHVNGGGTFNIGPGSTIDGNLQIQSLPASPGLNEFCGSAVNGDLQFQNNGAAMLIGGSAPALCTGNTIHGNLQVQNNSGVVTVAGNGVNGNLQVDNNTAATTVTGNIVKGNLQDQNNAGPTEVRNNAAGGNLQCQGNASITGSGNTAGGQKQGQCSTF